MEDEDDEPKGEKKRSCMQECDPRVHLYRKAEGRAVCFQVHALGRNAKRLAREPSKYLDFLLRPIPQDLAHTAKIIQTARCVSQKSIVCSSFVSRYTLQGFLDVYTEDRAVHTLGVNRSILGVIRCILYRAIDVPYRGERR